MKTVIKAGFWLAVISGAIYGLRKITVNVGDIFRDVDNDITEIFEGIYEPDDRLEATQEYFGSKGCDYESMKIVIDGDSSLIPKFLRKFLPPSLTAQQYVSAMWNWASNLEMHHGTRMINLSEDPGFANAWEWVVTQFAQINSYMQENNLLEKELFT